MPRFKPFLWILLLLSACSGGSGTAPDQSAPLITLTGAAVVTHEAGTPYTDSGATAADNLDGDLTAGIATVNTVNANVVGSYTVTFNVADTAGNAASEVTRLVNVVDTTAPVIVLSGAASVVHEAGTSYSDAGATATDNIEGDLSGGITVVSTVNTAAVGSYTVSYAVSDSRGNAATQIVRMVEVVDWVPADFMAKAQSDASVTLSWTVTGGLIYNLYRSTDTNCDINTLSLCANNASFLDKTSGFSDTGLTEGQRYYYWIEAGQNAQATQAAAPVSDTAVQATVLNADLKDYIENTLSFILSGSEGYVLPQASDLTSFDETLSALIARELYTAKTKAATIDYDLIHVVDAVNNAAGDQYCLRESIVRGRGFFCVDYNTSNPKHIAAPHPLYDSLTRGEAVDLLFGTNAKYLSISTTHRCANAATSSCSGTTSACGTSGPFKVSDMAHNVATFFHDFSSKIHTQESTLLTLQAHGCGSTACPSNGNSGDIVARLSAGTTQDLAASESVNLLKTELATTVAGLIGASVKSCSEAGELDRQLCGTTNVSGRYINGETTDPCQTAATVFTNSRFLHIEQNSDLRTDSGGADVIKPSILIDAINAVFPWP